MLSTSTLTAVSVPDRHSRVRGCLWEMVVGRTPSQALDTDVSSGFATYYSEASGTVFHLTDFP